MTPERWHKIDEVLQAALDLPPGDRASLLDEVCASDEELKEETSSLIAAYEEAGDFIETPAIAKDAHVIIGDAAGSHIGRAIGQYTIVERIGGGGMGEVYLARDDRLDRYVALKVLPPYFAADDIRLRRFQTEARAASALNHPNILTIHEVGEDERIRFIATEFIDGLTIRELLTKADLRIGEILDIVEQVALALAAAHQAGIVHRDIKPENIMRRPDGLVKILDFGIAKLTEEPRGSLDGDERRVETEVGVVMGTVDYMSPEQARGLPVDERTDLWSLGVVLYEMLTHGLPFSGATRMDSVVAILEREPEPIWQSGGLDQKVAAALQRIVKQSLEKKPSERYQTADQLLADLQSVKAHLRDPDLATRELALGTPKDLSKARLLKATLGVLSLLIAVAVGLGVYKLLRPVTRSDGTATSAPRLYSQLSEAEQLAFISEQEQRISNIMGDRPVKLDDEALRAIKKYVDYYTAHDETAGNTRSPRIEKILTRAPPYVPLIVRSFQARKVPVILGIYLPVIESAYHECAESSFGAKGLFQFMPQTARLYGVRAEEMCNAEKMTPAAAHYLADRMAELGEDSQSLTLVLLSYTTGPEWVRNSLRELRGTENYQRNFWTLFANREQLDSDFQKSAGYVPMFFAAAIIGENPQSFGLSMRPLSTVSGQ